MNHAIKLYPHDVSILKFRCRLGRSLYLMSEATLQQTCCSEHSGYRDILDCLPYPKVSLRMYKCLIASLASATAKRELSSSVVC